HLPSASTLYRAVRAIDTQALESQLACFTAGLESFHLQEGQSKQRNREGRFLGQSIDGKEIRGARAHGCLTHLVSLVRHESGTVLTQRAVGHKNNEIKAVPYLLAGQELTGTVTT